MTSPKLYFVFYRSPDDNYQLWGLYLDDVEPLSLEVTSQHSIFEPNMVKKRAERSTVGDVCRRYTADVETVKQVVKTVPVDNETVWWDCLDYVLGILDKLEDEYIWTVMMRTVVLQGEYRLKRGEHFCNEPLASTT